MNVSFVFCWMTINQCFDDDDSDKNDNAQADILMTMTMKKIAMSLYNDNDEPVF